MSAQPSTKQLSTTQHVRAALDTAYAEVTERAEAATTMAELALAARLHTGLAIIKPNFHGECRETARAALAKAINKDDLAYNNEVDDHLAVLTAIASEPADPGAVTTR